MTTLYLHSPYALHRDAWLALLSGQPGIRVAGELPDPSAVKPSFPPGPVTILVDVPELRPDAVAALRQHYPQAGLLLLVSAYHLPEVIQLLQSGATGLISRHESTAGLVLAIVAVGRGEFVLPPHIAIQSLLALARGRLEANPAAPSPFPAAPDREARLIEPLTEREKEVLRLLAQGLTNKDIAQTMVLSVRTVETHLRSIFAKIDVHSRTEAVLWAVRSGYNP